MPWRASAARPPTSRWRAGVDALSFGFTKNGGLSAEALIFFDPELADDAVRRKRAGHLLSKGRFLAAQILAMLEDDLWLATPAPPTPPRRGSPGAGAGRLLFRSRPTRCSSG